MDNFKMDLKEIRCGEDVDCILLVSSVEGSLLHNESSVSTKWGNFLAR
jgi:hypothetical protein